MAANRSVEFFETQFRRQVTAREFTLNPFEEAALPYLQGRVLDLGCGLGNLSVAAARRGCEVVAVEASPTAIEHLTRVALAEALPLTAVQRDVQQLEVSETFDVVVAIGLLMFFPRPIALELLEKVQRAVRPGGCAIVNVLVQGTTFMDMFDGDRYCLFSAEEVEAAFGDWTTLLARRDEFPAANGTVKRFTTLIARRPAGAGSRRP
ncbi:MAG TPA: class I SAM-dependent methyltransferase [Anaeromyxobacteraceae bacterium]|nr:class I SAM-dependent methyltransferase [Anaeromyxobacteraceae bacterium]